eukprot:m51a1_g12083 hypothetical protein (842) ;mRNA; f:440-5343
MGANGLAQAGILAASKLEDVEMHMCLLEALQQATERLARRSHGGREQPPAEQEQPQGGQTDVLEGVRKEHQALQMSLFSILAAARGCAVDAATKSLMVELARSVRVTAQEFCENAVPESGGAPTVQESTKSVKQAAVVLGDFVQSYSSVCADPSIQQRIADQLKILRKAMAGVVAAMAALGKNIDGAQADMIVFENAAKLMQDLLENPRIQCDSSTLFFLRSCGHVLLETERIAQQPEMCKSLHKSVRVIRRSVPPLLARAKAASDSPASLEELRQSASELSAWTRKLTESSDGDHRRCSFEAVRQAALGVRGAAQRLLQASGPRSVVLVHRVGVVDQAKCMVASFLRFKYAARLAMLRVVQDRMTQLEQLGAAGLAGEIVVRLLGDVRQASASLADDAGLALAEAAESFCRRKLVIPDECDELPAADPLRRDVDAAVDAVSADMRALYAEVRLYRGLVRRAEIAGAAEAFRAAQARMEALLLRARNRRSVRSDGEHRSKNLAVLSSQITAAVRSVEEAVSAAGSTSTATGVRALSAVAQSAVAALSSLLPTCRAPALLRSAQGLLAAEDALIGALDALAMCPESADEKQAALAACSSVSECAGQLQVPEDAAVALGEVVRELQGARTAVQSADFGLLLGAAVALDICAFLSSLDAFFGAYNKQQQQSAQKPSSPDPCSALGPLQTVAGLLRDVARAPLALLLLLLWADCGPSAVLFSADELSAPCCRCCCPSSRALHLRVATGDGRELLRAHLHVYTGSACALPHAKLGSLYEQGGLLLVLDECETELYHLTGAPSGCRDQWDIVDPWGVQRLGTVSRGCAGRHRMLLLAALFLVDLAGS